MMKSNFGSEKGYFDCQGNTIVDLMGKRKDLEWQEKYDKLAKSKQGEFQISSY